MNLIERRRQMMMSKSLPYDAEIEYLESTGTQYIQTSIVPTNTTGMYMEITRRNFSDSYCCGIRDTTGDTRLCIGTDRYFTYYGWGKSGNPFSLADGVNSIELNLYNSRKFVINNQMRAMNLANLSFTPVNSIRLFGTSGIDSSYTKWTGKLHAFKVTQGSDLVLDMLPVRIGQVGYMYDRVSGQLFGNQGTGNFVLGADKN